MRGFFMCFSQLVDTGSGQVEKCRSALASGAAAAVRPQSTGVCRLRGEPRQCGDRAHRLIPPSLAPTGERRPSMACLRPIPAPPRLSPTGCPWLHRCRLREVVKARSAEGWNTTPRRTSMQGVRVRAVHGCTAPACWSRTRNHAADANPLQRRPPPEAKLLPLSLRPPPEASAVALVVAAPPEADKYRRFSARPDPVALKLNFLPQLRATGSSREEIKRNSPAEAGLF